MRSELLKQEKQETIARAAQKLTHQTVYQIAEAFHFPLPPSPQHAKGWMGQLIEKALGCQAGSDATPDFPDCELELKTIPLSRKGRVQESTYITTCPLTLQNSLIRFDETILAQKMKHVLWVPLIDTGLGPLGRQIGTPFIWTPSSTEWQQLQTDWETIMVLLMMGEVDRLTAHIGQVLQVRPKAAHGGKTQKYLNQDGDIALTLPRGFYLRAHFTQRILNNFSSTRC